MKIFLTGATGFIGHPLTKSLLSRGWAVTALVRNPNSAAAQRLAQMGVQCVAGDVTDRESMRTSMAGADIVIHNAAWYEIGLHRNQYALMHDINIKGTENVLGLALELGISRTVYVSSISYYGDTGQEIRDETFSPVVPYLAWYMKTKGEAHEVAMRYQKQGLPLVTVCPAHVVGPNDHSIFGYYLRLYLNHLMPPMAFSPQMKFSPVHVEDVGNGIALASEKGRIGETYILSGDLTSVKEISDTWNSKSGSFKIRFYIPAWLAKAIFLPLEYVQRMMGLPAFMSVESVVTSLANYQFSSAKAQRELGWTYYPKREIWDDIFAKEKELLVARGKCGIVKRLKPH